MPFCANCGSSVNGAFCPNCGSSIGTGSTTPPGAATTPPPAAGTQSAGLEENVASALCYLLTIITGIIFLVISPYNQNKTIRFHAFQAIFFFVAAFAINFILGFILMMAPFGFWWISSLVHLAFFLIWLFLMWKAYNREKFLLPVIGELAEKQA
jgi:uncharacterized membrane protein